MPTHPEIGCYADGRHGHEYTRRGAGIILGYYAGDLKSRGAITFAEVAHVEKIAVSLMGDMPDDASDENEACEWLNEHAPFDGACWGWQDGDFGLWPE